MDVKTHNKLVADCLELWDQGYDTKDISAKVGVRESVVYILLSVSRNQRRATKGISICRERQE